MLTDTALKNLKAKDKFYKLGLGGGRAFPEAAPNPRPTRSSGEGPAPPGREDSSASGGGAGARWCSRDQATASVAHIAARPARGVAGLL